jgi:hypothetical protein
LGGKKNPKTILGRKTSAVTEKYGAALDWRKVEDFGARSTIKKRKKVIKQGWQVDDKTFMMDKLV